MPHLLKLLAQMENHPYPFCKRYMMSKFFYSSFPCIGLSCFEYCRNDSKYVIVTIYCFKFRTIACYENFLWQIYYLFNFFLASFGYWMPNEYYSANDNYSIFNGVQIVYLGIDWCISMIIRWPLTRKKWIPRDIFVRQWCTGVIIDKKKRFWVIF